MDEGLQHLRVDILSINSMSALTRLGKWLRTSHFGIDRTFRICSDVNGLQENARSFIEHFREQTMVNTALPQTMLVH